MSIIGLFLPIAGGFIYAIGPITEFSTAFLTTLLIIKLRRGGEKTL